MMCRLGFALALGLLAALWGCDPVQERPPVPAPSGGQAAVGEVVYVADRVGKGGQPLSLRVALRSGTGCDGQPSSPPGRPCTAHQVCPEVCCPCGEQGRRFAAKVCIRDTCSTGNEACQAARDHFGSSLCAP